MTATYRKSMTEGDMLAAFADLAHACGGYMWHVRHAAGQRLEGLPDVILAAPPVVALYELKTQRDRVSSLQQDVMTTLAGCDVVVSGIVRPVPKHDGELTVDEALSKVLCMRRDLELLGEYE